MNKGDFLMLAAHEAESRPIRHSAVKIMDYNPTHGNLGLAPVGSVVVYVGPKGSQTLAEIRKAAAAADGSDTQLAEMIHAVYKSRGPSSPYKAWRMIQSQPVFADIRYGGRSLVTHLAIPPGLDFIGVPSPYNGGRLSPDHLTLVEHVKEGSTAALEVVALRREPVLTPAERAAINLVPIDQSELNLAPNGTCCDDVTAYWAFVAVTVTLTCGDPVLDVHIAEDVLKQISPTAAAIQLMDIRREALTHDH